jgi:hypothetical protein
MHINSDSPRQTLVRASSGSSSPPSVSEVHLYDAADRTRGSPCGYCHGKKKQRYTYGMSCPTLLPADYQAIGHVKHLIS